MKRFLRDVLQEVLVDFPEWVKPLLIFISVVFLVLAVPYVAGLSIQLFGSWAGLGVIAAVYLFVAWMIS